MINVNQGGNPLLDRKQAVERFNTIVEPVFLKQGFRRLDKRSHTLINDTSKTIVFVTSAPSQTKTPNDFKERIKQFKKEFEGYSSYVLFTRDYSEWNNKTTYLNILKQVMAIRNISGIVTGLGNLTHMLKSVKSNEQFYIIN